MIRRTFNLRLVYDQYPDTHPAAVSGDVCASDDERILAWIMDAIPGTIPDDRDGDECATFVESFCAEEPSSC